MNVNYLRRFVRTFGANASQVAPPAGTIIADTGAMPSGVWNVHAAGSYGGVADVLDNMALFQGNSQVMSLPVIPIANSSLVFVSLQGMVISEGERLTIRNITAGGAGSVFRGTIVATPELTRNIT